MIYKGTQSLPKNRTDPYFITFERNILSPTIKNRIHYLFDNTWLFLNGFIYEKSYHLKVLSKPVQIKGTKWEYKVQPKGYTIRILRIKIKTKWFSKNNSRIKEIEEIMKPKIRNLHNL